MPTSHPPYPPEFRSEAIRLMRTSGKSLAQLARELDVSSETLRRRRNQAELDAGVRHDGLTSAEQDELRRLRRDVFDNAVWPTMIIGNGPPCRSAITASWSSPPPFAVVGPASGESDTTRCRSR